MVFIPWTRPPARNPKAVGGATPGISAQKAGVILQPWVTPTPARCWFREKELRH